MNVHRSTTGIEVEVPVIPPVGDQIDRPLWSVMIPTYNCAKYLRRTLESVLQQDPGPKRMQIQVVDDCSTNDDPQAVVENVGRGRVEFYRKAKNEGAIAAFNTCVQRSVGELVHILHGDDEVGVGYYETISDLAECHPKLGLYATRCFIIDEQSIILGVTVRIPELEQPGNSVAPFFYVTPVQFAGVTVRRCSYEDLGGFRTDLTHTADCEMWARITGVRGALISEKVMGLYREFSGNDSSRLVKTAENVRDICRLNRIFASRYPTFSFALGNKRTSDMAWQQYQRFNSLGDKGAAAANYRAWVEQTSAHKRVAKKLMQNVMPYVRRLV
jgi:hypothetical protein